MERTYSSHKIEELIALVRDSLSAITRDYGHMDEGYCLSCDNTPFDALDEIKNRFEKRPDWPTDIYEQYIVTLDERDKAIERAEKSEELLRYLRELLFQE